MYGLINSDLVYIMDHEVVPGPCVGFDSPPFIAIASRVKGVGANVKENWS